MKKRYFLLASSITLGLVFYYFQNSNAPSGKQRLGSRKSSKALNGTKGASTISSKDSMLDTGGNIDDVLIHPEVIEVSDINIAQAKQLLSNCIEKRKKLQEEWIVIENEKLSDKSFKLTEYELNIISQMFEETQCSLADLKSLKQSLSKQVLKHLENGNYLKAVKLETLFQKETSMLSAINWKVLNGVSEALKIKGLGESEKAKLRQNMMKVVDTTTSWKMEPFEFSMSIKLLKSILTNSAKFSSTRGELSELEKNVADLNKRFMEDSKIQMAYIDRDKERLEQEGQLVEIDKIMSLRAGEFSKNYLPIYRDSIMFQDEKLIPMINKMKQMGL